MNLSVANIESAQLSEVVGNGVTQGNQKQKFKKTFYGKKIFKLIKKFQNFFTFQGLIHEMNLIALGSLKWRNSYFLCVK